MLKKVSSSKGTSQSLPHFIQNSTISLCIISFLILRGASFIQHISFNHAAVVTLRVIGSGSYALSDVKNPWSIAKVSNCKAKWFEGLLEHMVGNNQLRDAAWLASIRCAPQFVTYLQSIIPDNQTFAEYSVLVQPEVADGWFWLAELRAQEIPEEAIELYYRGLQLDSNNRWRWQQLSDLLVVLDPHTASEIYSDLGLADPTINNQPESVDELFVWARILGQENPDDGAALFRELLKFRPYDGIYWRELGDILRDHDPQAAIEAYLKSCYNGDPGSNGCYRAGLVAEALGDNESAIRYYRLSKWSGSLEQADRLEQMRP